ncbi:MAG: NAD(+)/NADH kinase, partial [Negativicutes bacterium]|nr:NAD(+)/NADH kinase [Negativicutes bacterium]
MNSKFQLVALFGKYQTSSSSAAIASSRAALEAVTHFLNAQGCDVVLEADTASNMDMVGYPALTMKQIGEQCDLGMVVGGDGTMLGIGRQLASFGVPLIGINQGRLGFITDIPYDSFETCLSKMLRGDYV